MYAVGHTSKAIGMVDAVGHTSKASPLFLSSFIYYPFRESVWICANMIARNIDSNKATYILKYINLCASPTAAP